MWVVWVLVKIPRAQTHITDQRVPGEGNRVSPLDMGCLGTGEGSLGSNPHNCSTWPRGDRMSPLDVGCLGIGEGSQGSNPYN